MHLLSESSRWTAPWVTAVTLQAQVAASQSVPLVMHPSPPTSMQTLRLGVDLLQPNAEAL